MVTARRPLAWAVCSARRVATSSSPVRTEPEASSRSGISATREYNNSGSLISRSNNRGRACVPIRNRSPKPWVISSRTGVPVRSSSALVATVVPILTASMVSGLSPIRRRMPSTAASAYCAGSSLSSLVVTSAPSGVRPTRSVTVPPRSTQNCHLTIASPCSAAFANSRRFAWPEDVQMRITDWDDAYANGAYIPDTDRLMAAWLSRSEALRKAEASVVLRYGDRDRNHVDLYRPAGTPRGLIFYVHGGYWHL